MGKGEPFMRKEEPIDVFSRLMRQGDIGVAYAKLMKNPYSIVDVMSSQDLRINYLKLQSYLSQEKLPQEQVEGLAEIFKERRPNVDLTPQ